MGAFKSTDGGLTWAPANAGLAANEVYALAATAGTVYAGTERGVFRTVDAGSTWQPASGGLPVGACAP